MSNEVLEADLVDESNSEGLDFGAVVKHGKVDICANSKFRYLWFFVVYTAFALPLSFYNQWAITVGQDQYGLSKFLIVPLFFWATGIPFWIRPVWGVTLDNYTENPLGRRRHWIVIGVFGHIILLLPLAFVNVGASPWLWCILLGVALVPRVIAEQGIAALMVEYLPDPGSIGATISYAYRIGASVIPGLIIMSWWMGGVPFGSPFISGGVVDFDGVYFASSILVFVGLIAAAILAVMFREGERLRGLGIDDDNRSLPVASSVEEAMVNRDLDWPEGTPWWVRLKGAFNNRTAMIGLAIALLMPIGDGMESFFRSYQIEVWEWDSQRIASWAWVFVVAGFLGIIGPLISDFMDRRKSMLIWAVLAGTSYAVFTITSALDMGWQIQLAVWMFVLIFSDWLIFTFLATIVEIADPRMAASSMSVFQSVQAIAATGIFITIGTIILKISDSYFPLIWGVAILGPAIGFFLIRMMEYPPQDSERLNRFGSGVKEYVNKWTAGPLKLDELESRQQNQRMALAVGIVGLIILSVIGGISSVAEVESETVGDVESYATIGDYTTSSESTSGRIGVGETLTVEMDGSNGSISAVSVLLSIDNEDPSFLGGDFTWELTLMSPQNVNMSTGTQNQENTSSFTAQDLVAIIGTTELNGGHYTEMPFSSESEASEWLISRQSVDDAMYAAGMWEAELVINDDGDPLNRQADFTLEISLVEVTGNVTSMVIENATTTKTENFGPMIFGVTGLPVLIISGGVCWLVLRDEETN